jgi:hypothetical protein
VPICSVTSPSACAQHPHACISSTAVGDRCGERARAALGSVGAVRAGGAWRSAAVRTAGRAAGLNELAEAARRRRQQRRHQRVWWRRIARGDVGRALLRGGELRRLFLGRVAEGVPCRVREGEAGDGRRLGLAGHGRWHCASAQRAAHAGVSAAQARGRRMEWACSARLTRTPVAETSDLGTAGEAVVVVVRDCEGLLTREVDRARTRWRWNGVGLLLVHDGSEVVRCRLGRAGGLELESDLRRGDGESSDARGISLRLASAKVPQTAEGRCPRLVTRGVQHGARLGPGWVWVTDRRIGQWGQRRGLIQDDHVTRVLAR